MKISFNPYKGQYNSNLNYNLYPNFQPLKADVVSFTAMKKSQFEGWDLACVEGITMFII